jgi:hypothetical protein
MFPTFLRKTFTLKNAVSNGIWTIIYALVYAAISAVVPVVLHATTSLNGFWLALTGFALFCSLCAGTLAVWAYRSRGPASVEVVQQPIRPRDYQQRGALEPEAPKFCGDLLSRLVANAKHLEHELAHFHNWWPAVKDETFEGRLPDGFGPTTHAEAMQALLFAFAQFFSAAWTYQDLCRTGRDRAEVIEWVDHVYKALGDDPGGPTDATLNSRQLRIIGERSTERRGETEARPIRVADFEVELEDNQRLAAALKPLMELLLAADLDTEARTRLDATKEAVKQVEEKLGEMGHRR